jgi:hypothetical protein
MCEAVDAGIPDTTLAAATMFDKSIHNPLILRGDSARAVQQQP